MRQIRVRQWTMSLGLAGIAAALAALPLSAQPRISIPQDLGHMSEIRQPGTPTAPSKTLILIQDAHVNYQAQKNVAAILDRLVTEHGLKLVFVEGGSGDLSIAYLRHAGSQAARQDIAERYLQEGRITGQEYLDLVSEHSVVLWGVDDPALYDQAVGVFLDIDRIKAQAQAPLGLLQAAVQGCWDRLPNEPLKTFKAQRAAFDREELPFTDYLQYLWDEAARTGLPTAEWRSLAQVIEAKALEQGIDRQAVEQEQRHVVEQLRERLPHPRIAELRAIGREVNAKQRRPVDYYRQLGALAQEAPLSMEAFPKLSAYARLLELQDSMATQQFLGELRALQDALQAKLAQSDAETQLLEAGEWIDRFDRVFSLRWSPEDYEAYQRSGKDWQVEDLVPKLQALASSLGVSLTWPGEAAALDAQIANAATFYEFAAAREAGMVARALQKMDAEGQSIAAFVVGGFHTDHLTRMLAEQGIEAAVITPWVGPDDQEDRYERLLKTKYAERIPTRVRTNVP